MDVLRECCVENFEHVAEVIAAGAARIELCDNLAVGGTTPSAGVIGQACAIAHAQGAAVNVMIRPRGGSFCYTQPEVEAMLADIEVAASAGADGLVFGCLRQREDATLALDEPALARLLDAAHGLPCTFHMAFDELPNLPARLAAIDTLASMGFARILTHGSADPATRIEDNLCELKTYAARAHGRIIMMPGGGVTWENVEHIASAIGSPEAHGTKIVRF